MKKHIHTKLNEFVTNGITEQAIYSKIPFNIVLNGGGDGGGRNEHGEAHFHLYFDNIEYKIKLPVKKINKITIDDLIEIDDSHILPNKVKKKVLTFLLSDCDSSVDGKTNLEEMAVLWNGINKFNPVAFLIKKEDMKKYRE